MSDIPRQTGEADDDLTKSLAYQRSKSRVPFNQEIADRMRLYTSSTRLLDADEFHQRVGEAIGMPRGGLIIMNKTPRILCSARMFMVKLSVFVTNAISRITHRIRTGKR